MLLHRGAVSLFKSMPWYWVFRFAVTVFIHSCQGNLCPHLFFAICVPHLGTKSERPAGGERGAQTSWTRLRPPCCSPEMPNPLSTKPAFLFSPRSPQMCYLFIFESLLPEPVMEPFVLCSLTDTVIFINRMHAWVRKQIQRINDNVAKSSHPLSPASYV